MDKNLKIKKGLTLYIMGSKGYAVLQHIIKNYEDMLLAVITAKDTTIAEDYYSQIQNECKVNNIPCYSRGHQDNATIGSHSLAISWKWLIPNDTSLLIILHDSLLPKYRGFNPLVSMLINNESRIGVTALYANEKYDRGNIIGSSFSTITYPMKISDAITTVTKNYIDLVEKICSAISANETLPSQEQDESKATYSLWRDEEDYKIDWRQDAQVIKRFIDAVGHPYKGARTTIKGKCITINDGEIMQEVVIENRTPGKVIFIEHGNPIVVCGTGLLKLTNLIDQDGNSLLPFKNIRTRFI